MSRCVCCAASRALELEWAEAYDALWVETLALRADAVAMRLVVEAQRGALGRVALDNEQRAADAAETRDDLLVRAGAARWEAERYAALPQAPPESRIRRPELSVAHVEAGGTVAHVRLDGMEAAS